ncbi:MAG: helix-turn-helix domain-containing protein [Solirubrobacteraceae bacterium]
MANENLKNALEHAGMTVEQFAEIIQVDPKTVQRWVSGTTVPYPRNRGTVARALGLSARDLWPDEMPLSLPVSVSVTADPVGPDRVPEGDLVGSWGNGEDLGAPSLLAFIAGARNRLDVLDDRGELLRRPGAVEALLARADAGCEIRLLSVQALRRLGALIGHQNIEVRLAVNERPGLLRAGEAMLVTLALSGQLDMSPVVLQLARRVDGGLHDRFAAWFEQAWDHPEEILTDPAQLDAHLRNDEDDEDWDWEHAPAARPIDPPNTVQPPIDPEPSSQETAEEGTRRRWPRRPG